MYYKGMVMHQLLPLCTMTGIVLRSTPLVEALSLAFRCSPGAYCRQEP